MKNEIKKQLTEVIENNLVEYFANCISSSNFIDRFIKPIVAVSDEQSYSIADIMAAANQDWDAAPCDPEGANPEQDANLDRILKEAAAAIIAEL